jgi:hypothetical protein
MTLKKLFAIQTLKKMGDICNFDDIGTFRDIGKGTIIAKNCKIA